MYVDSGITCAIYSRFSPCTGSLDHDTRRRPIAVGRERTIDARWLAAAVGSDGNVLGTFRYLIRQPGRLVSRS